MVTTLQLFRQYGAAAVGILADIGLRRVTKVPVMGRMFYQNTDRSTLFHVVHSYPKIERMVNALPDKINGAVIDCGANNGLFSFCMAHRYPDAKIYAVEPLNELEGVLAKNIPHATVIKKAVAGPGDQVVFYSSADSDQVGSIFPENVAPFVDRVTYRHAEKTTLDELTYQYRIGKISVLKVDIQGAELLALEYGRTAMEKADFLFLEVFLYDSNAVDLVRLVGEYFPYHKPINPIIYGADILFSKVKVWS